jgi:hypothetical protein
LNRRPDFRDLIHAHARRRDFHHLYLTTEERRPQLRWQPALDFIAPEHRNLVQDLHAEAEQHFRLELLRTIGRQQIVKIECQRRGGPARPPLIARRQIRVAPSRVLGCLMEIQVEARRNIGARGFNRVWRDGGDLGVLATQGRIGVLLDEPGFDDIAQYCCHACDRKGRTHRRLPRAR